MANGAWQHWLWFHTIPGCAVCVHCAVAPLYAAPNIFPYQNILKINFQRSALLNRDDGVTMSACKGATIWPGPGMERRLGHRSRRILRLQQRPRPRHFTTRLLPISWLFRETLSHTLSHLHQQISISASRGGNCSKMPAPRRAQHTARCNKANLAAASAAW